MKAGADMAKRRKTKRKNTRRAPARRSNPTPARRRRRKSNPKPGLSAADMKDLGAAAAGGMGAGILTGYLEKNKPEMLKAVPTEIISAGLGVALATFGKTPVLKNLSAGMISFAAGSYAKNITTPKVEGLFSPSVGALMYNPHNGHGEEIHVGALTYAIEE